MTAPTTQEEGPMPAHEVRPADRPHEVITTLVGTPTRQRRRRRRLTMILDGGFLAAAGATQLGMELIGHFLDRGPLAAIFAGSPYTIGWVEAHGLAAILGIGFAAVGGRDDQRFWHRGALAVHVLLGSANLLFWSSFVAFGTVRLGVAATVVHAAFVLVQLVCLASFRPREQP